MSNRIEREVEELLTNIERFPPKKPLSRRIKDTLLAPFRAVGRTLGGIHLPNVSPGHVLLGAVILIVIAWVAGDGSDFSRWVIALGILVFIGAFIWSLRRQSRPSQPKYWRDQPMDLGGGGDGRSWWDRWRGRR